MFASPTRQVVKAATGFFPTAFKYFPSAFKATNGFIATAFKAVTPVILLPLIANADEILDIVGKQLPVSDNDSIDIN